MPIDELQDIRLAMKETIYQVTLDKLENECNSLNDLKKILKSTLEIIADSIHAEASSVWLYDKKEGILTPYVTYGGAKITGLKIDAKKSIAGKVTTSKKSILVDNVKNNKNWSSSADKKSGFETKTMICVPAVYDNISLGCVQFVNRIDEESYDEKDLGFVQSIVNYILFRISNNKEFIGYMVKENNDYADSMREQVITNFLTILSVSDKKVIEETFEHLPATRNLGDIDSIRLNMCISTLQKIAQKTK